MVHLVEVEVAVEEVLEIKVKHRRVPSGSETLLLTLQSST